MNPEVLNNPKVFSQTSTCPIVNGAVTLGTNTWEQHIKAKHPEVANSLQHIQNAVANPAYVAQSLPGPGQAHADNIVFVSMDAKIRTSTLHVFVESPNSRPVITTAIYSKRRHSNILWNSKTSEVQASYDRDADVLYISKNEPVPALTEESDDGVLLRYSLSNEKPCGVTVVSFHQHWSQNKVALVDKVSTFLDVATSSTERALAGL